MGILRRPSHPKAGAAHVTLTSDEGGPSGLCGRSVMNGRFKRRMIGTPLATEDEQHQRLGIPTALAVFASDAISSTAYASQEILIVLIPVAGLSVALNQLVPISLIVMVLLVLVITSYRQTIFAYPGGGGSYVVSRENLGENPSLVAGASLLVDYILTVAVSVSAGVAAITSAFPALRPERVEICLGFIAIMTVANLRGMKESGRLFAGPTYVYIVALFALISVGLFRLATGSLEPLVPDTEALNELTHGNELTGLTVLIFLRAFSSGAVALTGVEAISNGVPAFKKPESKHAATTLLMMGTILATFFFGISLLASRLRPTPNESETLLSLMGREVFNGETLPYYILQFSTFAILILAANTAFADFPRVSSILAQDGYLPAQLKNRGDRLVFSNGILALAAVAALLIVVFSGDTSKLIPLYAVGVFCGFTLSQIGMVRHHQTLREPSWRRGVIVNSIGAVATFIVLMVVVVSKFAIGAWIPAVLIPIIVVVFKRIKRHYTKRSGGAEGRARRSHSSPLAHGRDPRRQRQPRCAQGRCLRPVDAAGSTRGDQRGDIGRGGDSARRCVGEVRAPRRASDHLLGLPRPHWSCHAADRRTRRRASGRCRDGGHPRVRGRALVGSSAPQPERAGHQEQTATAAEHGDPVGADPDR